MSYNKLFPVIIFFVIILSCSTTAYNLNGSMKKLPDKAIVVDTILLKDIIDTPVSEDAFNRNIFVGIITFSGGIVNNTALNNVQQSLNRQYFQEKEFTDTARPFLNDIVISILDRNSLTYKRISLGGESGISIQHSLDYDIIIDRAKYPEDGQDNINLPRINYRIRQLPEKTRQMLASFGSDYAIIPVIEYYYGHNGGWFNDQEWGCSAGVRMACQIYVFDLKTGSPVLAFRKEQRKIIPLKFSISHPDLSREMFEIEKEVRDSIEDALL